VPFDQKIFDEVVSDLKSLDVDEIKARLEPVLIGYSITSPVFDPGAFLYRARRLTPDFKKENGISRQDLIYPPASAARLGRLNREGRPVFYSSIHKQSVFFELPDLKDGDEIIVSFWKTTERMFVNNIGYTEFAFSRLGANRAVPTWQPPSPPTSTESVVSLRTMEKEEIDRLLEKDKSVAIKQAFSMHFMRPVSPEESHLYKLTTAIGEMHLGNIPEHSTEFAGILYPSVRMWANGDNLALQPWFVDRHLEFRKAVQVKIKNRRETDIDVDYLDAAHAFDEMGKLIWLGRLQNWTLRPLQRVKFTATGPDADGDYTVDPNGVPVHWEAVDERTGEAIIPG
jgi:hypothetical protein